MYKSLLCWRYLRTRYIALASVVSVTLGVATMIVVNSVMAGFTQEMQLRIHGILSDLVFESHSLGGFPDVAWHKREIDRVAGESIAGMTATVHVPAMLSFQVRNQWQTRQVNFIGVDPENYDSASDFGKYLQHPENRRQLGFRLHDGGYDLIDHQGGSEAIPRTQMREAGWIHRRTKAHYDQWQELQQSASIQGKTAVSQDPFLRAHQNASSAASRGDSVEKHSDVFDPARDQHTGVVLGIAIASYRDRDGKDRFLLLPGDDVRLTFPTAATPPTVISDVFTVVDFYESKMSEYDASFVFSPLKRLQQLRGMIDPSTGVASSTSIQIKLKKGVDLNKVRDLLRAHFSPQLYGIYTWRDKQGPLLAAVQMETAILNVLLFLIIAVAGFGTLAIFFMIVVEKTRDIGILKSLGASGRGIMSIFLTYGLSLGLVGSGAGMLLGLLFVWYINEIAGLLAKITGKPLFDPSIYYFHSIPTIINPFTIFWIVTGAVFIAILASILPARRAARLHPVEALRFE